MRTHLVLAAVMGWGTLVPCYAQNASTEPAYAPLIAAARTLVANVALRDAIGRNATLSEKRKALFDKDVSNALSETRRWLDKPLNLSEPLDFGMVSPAFAEARQVGRAFAVQIYVQFADGRTKDAIDTARDGLRLAYALEHHSLLGWLTGSAIEPLILNTLTERLNQLSFVDCKRLFTLAEDWAKTANLLEVALERERLASLAQLKAQLNQNEADWKQTETQLTKAYQQVVQLQRQPYWEREELALPEGTAQASVLAGVLRPVFQQVSDKPVRRLAQARMLGCHAAIRQYRWENRHLPTTLNELKIGDMAIDPFTGKEFRYEIKMETFTLESAGGYERDDKGTVNKEKRLPVTLTP